MASYRIKRMGQDVTITVIDNGTEESVTIPERVFQDILEDVRLLPEVHAYPVGLEVQGSTIEVPYEDLLKLARQLEKQGMLN